MIYLALTDDFLISKPHGMQFADYTAMSVWAKAESLSPTRIFNTGRKPTDPRWSNAVSYGHLQVAKISKKAFTALSNDPAPTEATYETMRAEAIAAGDHKFCAPLAIALATDNTFAASAKVLTRFGRKQKQGATLMMIRDAIQELGFKIENYPEFASGTVSTIARKLDKDSKYMVLVAGHIICVKNGKVEDWTAGRKHRVTHVWKVSAEM